MSCLCPISIPDKVARDYGVSGASIVVPCGHCAECARDRRNDWFVRIWSAYQRYCDANTPVWFVTITINPRLWPDMNLNSPGIGDRITPFVRSWNERLRYLNNGVMPLRFICSEFGSNGREYMDHNGVLRVTTGALHFHGVLFGYLPIRKIKEGFERTHGHVDFDLIRGPQGIRYVVKYATKDFSIDDPKLRSRVFCSPGIGDSSFYFGDSAPTSVVLINGFHYRTPRYFIDKQWLRMYTKDRFYDSDGRSLVVRQSFSRRLEQARLMNAHLESLKTSDFSYRDYAFSVLRRDSRIPATLDQVRVVLAQGLTGPSHPLLRQHYKSETYRSYVAAVSSDDSFVNYKPIIQTFNNQFYERDQIVFPLSLDFET